MPVEITFRSHWIDKRDFMKCPTRSTDLTPLHFFCGSYLKTFYETSPEDIQKLRLTEKYRRISRKGTAKRCLLI